MLKEDEKEQAKLKGLHCVDELKKCIEFTKKYLDYEVNNRKHRELSEY